MKYFAFLAAFATLSAAEAEITYKVTVQPGSPTLHVAIQLPNTRQGTRWQLPNWGPGAYFIGEGFKNVSNFSATDSQDKPLKIEKVMTSSEQAFGEGVDRKSVSHPICTWVIEPAGSTKIEYDIPVRSIDGAVHWSGPSTYLYETTRRHEACRLVANLPTGWKAYTGLDEAKRQPNVFSAREYDVLADNPVSTGDIDVDQYVSRGKPHFIVLMGKARAKVDRPHLLKACKFVSDAETDFFGSQAPYNKYVWHFTVNNAADGAGGLEHLSSTEISLASGVGPRAVSVLAHEFFHLWNVKRIRSRVLGPFDYTKLPQTGALWWLEGVTDYYAFTLLHRYGWTDDASYFGTIVSNLVTVRRNPAHTEVGPFEASYRVGETSGGRGNSNGYRISYYNLGWLAGMVLDLQLRTQTSGKRSLDDVEHALWAMCRNNQPGFEEGEIRRQLVRFGGPTMGDVYDKVVMKGGDMMVEDSLSRVGLRSTTKMEPFVDLGFTWMGGMQGDPGLYVGPQVSGPAIGKLTSMTRITAVDGVPLTGVNGRELSASMATAMKSAVGGKTIRLTVVVNGQDTNVEVIPVASARPTFVIEKSPYASDEKLKLRQDWLAVSHF